MSSPVAVVGLRYDGTDLQSDLDPTDTDGQLFLQITSGLWEHPSVRGTDTTVPGLEGRVEGNRVKDVLPVELDGFVRAPLAGTLADAHEAFVTTKLATRELFATDRERATLQATLEDGTVLEIEARPMTSSWPERVPGLFSELHLQLEAYGDWAEVVVS